MTTAKWTSIQEHNMIYIIQIFNENGYLQGWGGDVIKKREGI
jgi:hypothetical protein